MTELLRTPYEISLNDIVKHPYLFPRVSPSKLKKMRMTDIALYSMITADNARYLVNLLKKILVKYNINLKNMNGLDLGCNTGGILYYLLQECKHVVGVEFEPLHIKICYHNITTLDKKLLDKLTLMYGDVEEIFMDSNINISNMKYYNNRFIKSKTKNSEQLNSIDFVYIGTPFIDLKYGNTSVEELVLKMVKIYNPKLVVVQLPCAILNNIHTNFYKIILNKLLDELNNIYDISFMFDYKQNTRCSNIHLILIKRPNKVIRYDITTKKIYIRDQTLLQNILQSIVIKYNIQCYSYKFNIKNIWRELYSKSYYTNVIYSNSKLKFNSITRGKNGMIEPCHFTIKYNLNTDKLVKNNNISCKVKYDRFTNEVKDVFVVRSL